MDVRSGNTKAWGWPPRCSRKSTCKNFRQTGYRTCPLFHDRLFHHFQRPTVSGSFWQRILRAGARRQYSDAQKLRKELEDSGSIFQSTMDSEIVVHRMAHHLKKGEEHWNSRALRLEGAYCSIILTKDKIIAARDPRGFRLWRWKN